MTDRHTFGPRLRAHRERRGITLAALADSIKVTQSLLDDFERNDLSRWPPGIYGRALVREYAKSIGLPAAETLEEFCELFPEAADRDRAASQPRDVPVDSRHADLRLVLAGVPTQTPRSLYWSVLGAVVELAFLLTIGYLVTRISALTFGTANAVVALTWYPINAAFSGNGILARLVRVKRLGASRVRPLDLPLVAPDVFVIPNMIGSAGLDREADPLVGDGGAQAGSVSIH
jgi:transcriptional regulator with XRE-family HTH domain